LALHASQAAKSAINSWYKRYGDTKPYSNGNHKS